MNNLTQSLTSKCSLVHVSSVGKIGAREKPRIAVPAHRTDGTVSPPRDSEAAARQYSATWGLYI